LEAKGTEALAVAVDLTSPEGRQKLAEAIRERFGRLDVLINNAGVAAFGEFSDSSEAILRQIMETNFFAPVEIIRVCLPLLQEARRLDPKVQPTIVNISSICGRRGIASYPEHCASKFALTAMTEALRSEFARFDIDVLLVVPGLTKADDLGSHLLRNEGKIDLNFSGAQSADNVAKGIVSALRSGARESVIGMTARWVWRGQQFFPRMMDWIMARKVRQFQEREAGQKSQQQ